MPYKIVSSKQIPDEYQSLAENSEATVIYAIGIKTKPNPKCGPLTAFQTMKDVYNFAQCNGWYDYPIFKVRIIKYKGKRKALWSLTDRELGICHLPPGTVLCSSITLIKRVYS